MALVFSPSYPRGRLYGAQLDGGGLSLNIVLWLQSHYFQVAEGSIWAVGATPTFLEKCTVYPCDVSSFGAYHRQKEQWDKNKAQTLDDVYCQTLHNKDKVYYAELIQQGYVIKGPENENRLLCNVAVTAEKSRQV